MPSKPVVLILGAGANVGLATARHFAGQGWSVVAASRTPSAAVRQVCALALSADLAEPAALAPVFARCVAEAGVPAAVIYNAYTFVPAPVSNPLSVAPPHVLASLAVDAATAYEAMRLAVAAWDKAAQRGVFLYTGNMMATQLHPLGLVLGMGKNAAAYAIETAAAAYAGRHRFYYVDERSDGGESVFQHVDGEAHAREFEKLARMDEQGEWMWTFVKGKGYVAVDGAVKRELRVASIPGFE